MTKRKWPFFKVEGDPYEVGFKYGQLTENQIHQSLNIYRLLFLERSNIEWSKALEIAETFVPLVQEYDEEVIEEVRGIAQGAGVKFHEIMALNSYLEIIYSDKSLSGGCTSVAVLPEASHKNHTLLGQNLDEMPACNDTMILLEIKRKGGVSSLNYIQAGMVPTNGMNSVGIGVLGNTLETGRDRGLFGIPFAFQRRKILASNNIYAAIEAIAGAKSSSPHNHMIGSKEGFVINFETNLKEIYTLYPEGGMIVHTNHFVYPNIRRRDKLKYMPADSLYRDWRMKQILEPKRGKIEVSDLKEAFMDHFGYPRSICRHPEDLPKKSGTWQTVGSIIMDLNTGEIQVAAGCPCESTYEVYRLPLDR